MDGPGYSCDDIGNVITKEYLGHKEYFGDWKDGKYNGYGVIYHDSVNLQYIYEGEWQKGIFSGYGVRIGPRWNFRGNWVYGNPIGTNQYDETQDRRYIVADTII